MPVLIQPSNPTLRLLGSALAACAASLVFAQDVPNTLGDAIRLNEKARAPIHDGSAQVAVSSASSSGSLGLLTTHTLGEARFNARTYTNAWHVTKTEGYVHTYTLPDGTKGKGQVPGDDSLYARYLDDPQVKGQFELLRGTSRDPSRGKYIEGADLYEAAPRINALRNDLLLVGRCLPYAELTPESLKAKLVPIAGSRDLAADFDVEGGRAHVVVSPEDDGLFRSARVEADGWVRELRVDRFERVAGVALPAVVHYTDAKDGKQITDTSIEFVGAKLNDGSHPELVRVPPNQLIQGFVGNKMYVADQDGRPVFVREKGRRTDASVLKGLLYTGSLALVVFAASATLARSLRRRAASPKRAGA